MERAFLHYSHSGTHGVGTLSYLLETCAVTCSQALLARARLIQPQRRGDQPASAWWGLNSKPGHGDRGGPVGDHGEGFQEVKPGSREFLLLFLPSTLCSGLRMPGKARPPSTTPAKMQIGLFSRAYLPITWPIEFQGRHKDNSLTALCQKNDFLGLGCSSVVQHLPSMRKALGSIPAPKQKRQSKQTYTQTKKILYPSRQLYTKVNLKQTVGLRVKSNAINLLEF
jgi:hypothetical protein